MNVWLIVIVIAGIMVIASLVLGLFYWFSHMKPSQMAFDFVQKSADFQRILGEPICKSPFGLGAVSINNLQGSANLRFKISGSKSSGKLRVIAYQMDDDWSLAYLSYLG
jgi:hypothetical protein